VSDLTESRPADQVPEVANPFRQVLDDQFHEKRGRAHQIEDSISLDHPGRAILQCLDVGWICSAVESGSRVAGVPLLQHTCDTPPALRGNAKQLGAAFFNDFLAGTRITFPDQSLPAFAVAQGHVIRKPIERGFAWSVELLVNAQGAEFFLVSEGDHLHDYAVG
jgi:hypothetical protein